MLVALPLILVTGSGDYLLSATTVLFISLQLLLIAGRISFRTEISTLISLYACLGFIYLISVSNMSLVLRLSLSFIKTIYALKYCLVSLNNPVG
jgi:hypothetical protein